MIKNIIFDFDGVLCESVNIKTEAFYEMYLPYGDEIAIQVRKYHIDNGGMSRYDKFTYYENILLKTEITDEKMQKLSTIFSNLVMHKIIKAPFVKGAFEFLEKFSKNYICFIVSATPLDEIQIIAKEKNICQYFEKIFGSPTNKIEWGKYILDNYHINAEETLFIGDAMSDYKASFANKMHFLLRNTEDNKNMFSSEVPSVNNLINLHKIIKTYSVGNI